MERHGLLLVDEMSTRESVQVLSRSLTYTGLIDFGEEEINEEVLEIIAAKKDKQNNKGKRDRKNKKTIENKTKTTTDDVNRIVEIKADHANNFIPTIV